MDVDKNLANSEVSNSLKFEFFEFTESANPCFFAHPQARLMRNVVLLAKPDSGGVALQQKVALTLNLGNQDPLAL